MAHPITQLAPEILWKHFHALTQIPRPSKHEEQIQQFIIKFGHQYDLKTVKDSSGNIIIRKPASKGMEDRKGIILQAHLDMVPQKNTDKTHDFVNDPIETIIDGDWVTANDTTLGADNGIGVAAALAVLESTDITHGPIEVLFTADEETGMTGALGLKPEMLNGDILLNLDSEDDNELCIGCAGGVDINITVPYEPQSSPSQRVAFQIDIRGLKGGHSGIDIHLGRANAVLLFFHLVQQLKSALTIDIASMTCGSLRNAIPREASAIVLIHENDIDRFNTLIQNFQTDTVQQYQNIETNIHITNTAVDLPSTIIPAKTVDKIASLLSTSPNGVIQMSQTIDNLVETSNNIASAISDEDSVHIQMLVRSSDDTDKMNTAKEIQEQCHIHQFSIDIGGAYPGWQPNSHSEILELATKQYQHNFDSTPTIKAIHAGLECGILSTNYPHWDMLSIGPTIRFPHSPDEKVNIQSVHKFWTFLVDILSHIPK